MYVDISKAAELDENSLLGQFITQGVFVPQVGQRLYMCFPELRHFSLFRIAKEVTSVAILAKPGVTRQEFNALNELLAHFGFFIAPPPFVLSPEQAVHVCALIDRLDKPFSSVDAAQRQKLVDRGFLDGMAYGLGTSWDELVATAQVSIKERTKDLVK